MITNIAQRMTQLLPPSRYDFKPAVQNGRMATRNKPLTIGADQQLVLYNSCTDVPDFFDCSIGARFAIEQSLNEGVTENNLAACQLAIPERAVDGKKRNSQHIFALAQEGDRLYAIGLTPFDQLLGIHPCAEVSKFGSLSWQIRHRGKIAPVTQARQLLLDPQKLVIGTKSYSMLGACWKIRLPFISYSNTGRELTMSEIEITTNPLSGLTFGYVASLIRLRGRFFWSLQTMGRKGIMIQTSLSYFSRVLQALQSSEVDYESFKSLLFEYKIGSEINAQRGKTGTATLDTLLASDWPLVLMFLRKLPAEIFA